MYFLYLSAKCKKAVKSDNKYFSPFKFFFPAATANNADA